MCRLFRTYGGAPDAGRRPDCAQAWPAVKAGLDGLGLPPERVARCKRCVCEVPGETSAALARLRAYLADPAGHSAGAAAGAGAGAAVGAASAHEQGGGSAGTSGTGMGPGGPVAGQGAGGTGPGRGAGGTGGKAATGGKGTATGRGKISGVVARGGKAGRGAVGTGTAAAAGTRTTGLQAAARGGGAGATPQVVLPTSLLVALEEVAAVSQLLELWGVPQGQVVLDPLISPAAEYYSGVIFQVHLLGLPGHVNGGYGGAHGHGHVYGHGGAGAAGGGAGGGGHHVSGHGVGGGAFGQYSHPAGEGARDAALRARHLVCRVQVHIPERHLRVLVLLNAHSP